MIRKVLLIYLLVGFIRAQGIRRNEWKKRLEHVEQKLDHIAEQLVQLASSSKEKQVHSIINDRLDSFQRNFEEKLINFTAEVERKSWSKLTEMEAMQADEQILNSTVAAKSSGEGEKINQLLQNQLDEILKSLKSVENTINLTHEKELRRLGRVMRAIQSASMIPPNRVTDEEPIGCSRVDSHLQRMDDDLKRGHKDIQQGVNLLQHQLALDMGSGLRAMQVDILQCTRSVTELHKSLIDMPRTKLSERLQQVPNDDPMTLIFNRHPRPIGRNDAYLEELPSMQVVNTVLAERPRSCAEIFTKGHRKSGIFSIWPQFNSSARLQLYAYCDMTTEGGGWTVIQRRGDYGGKLENFTRLWADYKRGFGDVTREFWLGLDAMVALSHQEPVVLRIELQLWSDKKGVAEYYQFQIADESDLYRLTIGNFSGDVPDCMEYHNGSAFSTLDSNNAGLISRQCAKYQGQGGGWWYNNCYRAKLNSPYYPTGNVGRGEGIQWRCWQGYEHSLKFAEMKVRPHCFPEKCDSDKK